MLLSEVKGFRARRFRTGTVDWPKVTILSGCGHRKQENRSYNVFLDLKTQTKKVHLELFDRPMWFPARSTFFCYCTEEKSGFALLNTADKLHKDEHEIKLLGFF